jgi:RNA-splicing ligase RtcB
MDDAVFDQITNVATLPGVTNYALCMPDGHFGYGFPIGGVAAMDAEEGVISPGGIGFDINCGMRLVTTNLTYDDVKPHLKQLVDRLYERVPAGVGSTGFIRISKKEFRQVERARPVPSVHKWMEFQNAIRNLASPSSLEAAWRLAPIYSSVLREATRLSSVQPTGAVEP